MTNPIAAAIGEILEQRIAECQLEVPMLPQVANKALRLTQDPESEASDLAKLIQSDQTLAGKVMRVANSAAYSPNSSIVSLQQAITRLGMRLIAEIALSASINTKLFNTPGYEAHIKYQIEYALASALWAKEAARACRKNVEAAFLTGLLHDIGRPVAVQTILEIAKDKNLQPSREDVMALEQKFQHKIGLRVVEKWEMPSSVCQSLQYFLTYNESHAAQLQTMIVVAGSTLASHFMCEESEGKECMTTEELKSQPIFGDLNLYADQIDDILLKEEIVTHALEAFAS